jgi:hypothetical protein
VDSQFTESGGLRKLEIRVVAEDEWMVVNISLNLQFSDPVEAGFEQLFEFERGGHALNGKLIEMSGTY